MGLKNTGEDFFPIEDIRDGHKYSGLECEQALLNSSGKWQGGSLDNRYTVHKNKSVKRG